MLNDELLDSWVLVSGHDYIDTFLTKVYLIVSIVNDG